MPTNNAQLGTNYRCVNRKYLTSLGLNASNNEKLLVGSDITDTFRANIVNIINGENWTIQKNGTLENNRVVRDNELKWLKVLQMTYNINSNSSNILNHGWVGSTQLTSPSFDGYHINGINGFVGGMGWENYSSNTISSCGGGFSAINMYSAGTRWGYTISQTSVHPDLYEAVPCVSLLCPKMYSSNAYRDTSSIFVNGTVRFYTITVWYEYSSSTIATLSKKNNPDTYFSNYLKTMCHMDGANGRYTVDNFVAVFD